VPGNLDKTDYEIADFIMGTERGRPSDQDIEAAWSKEIERRLAEIDAGVVELIPGRTFEPNFSLSRMKVRLNPQARVERH
jgi:Putative addiction module component